MAHRRHVWRLDRAGSLDRLRRVEDDLPEPGPGEVRVAVRAIGLNFADIFACLGLYSATPRGPFVPGLEFAGHVDAVGPPAADSREPSPFQRGDAVAGLTRFGGYATAINIDWRYVRALRQGWSLAEGAAFPAQALTAWYGLVRLGAVERGHMVLVQSAAGGVGLNALAILNTVGARVIAVVGQPSKREWLLAHRQLPPALVVVRKRRTFGADLDAALQAAHADGFDLVFDAVAGPFFTPAYDRLNPEGRYVVYGAADFMTPGVRVNYPRLAARYLRRPRLDPLRMVSENRSVMGFNLIWLWNRIDRLSGGYEALEALLTAPPVIGRRLSFPELPAALRCLQSGDTVGKVVVEVP